MNGSDWTLFGLGGLFVDQIDAIEAGGGRVLRIVLNQEADPALAGKVPSGIHVELLKGLQGFRPTTRYHGFAFADPRKQSLLNVLDPMRLEMPPMIHPTAWVSPRAAVARGVFVGAQVAVAANARVGEFSFLNRLVSVGHDVEVGAFSQIFPNAAIAGHSRLGSRVRIGAGATVIDHIRIADDVVVGAGAVVVRDITVAGTYVGVPARRVERGPIAP